jgi:hypothetical protein
MSEGYQNLDIDGSARRADPHAKLLAELADFVTHHRPCGQLTGDATEPELEAYMLSVGCGCGVTFLRWVTRGRRCGRWCCPISSPSRVDDYLPAPGVTRPCGPYVNRALIQAPGFDTPARRPLVEIASDSRSLRASIETGTGG